jgi:UDP-N-acetylmuramoyl-tripeptide--D-alanyl-D-alanine ligase
MEEAIKELLRLKKKRTVAVLGDMLELGAYSEDEHKKLVRRLSSSDIEVLIAVGQEMKRASSEFRGTCFQADDSSQAGDILGGIWREGDTVLVKGSRGMLMEKVLADPEKLLRIKDSHAL